MAYDLGIDVGVALVAAAVHHENGATAVVPLGTPTNPPVARRYLAASGMTSLDQPGARIVVAQEVLREVTAQMGSSPRSIVITHPGGWSSADTAAIERALGGLGWGPAGAMSELQAAALALWSSAPPAAGAIVAVCLVTDLGAHAAVFRAARSGLKLLSRVLMVSWPSSAPPSASELHDVPILLDNTLTSASLAARDITHLVVAGTASQLPTAVHLLQTYSTGKVTTHPTPAGDLVALGAALAAGERFVVPSAAPPVTQSAAQPAVPPPPPPVRRALLAPPAAAATVSPSAAARNRPTAPPTPAPAPPWGPGSAPTSAPCESPGSIPPPPERRRRPVPPAPVVVASSAKPHGSRPPRSARRQALRVTAGAAALFAAAAAYGFKDSSSDTPQQLVATPTVTVATSPATMPVTTSIVASAGALPPESTAATQPVVANKIPGMVSVPGGNYVVGMTDGGTTTDNSRATNVATAAYFIDTTEVTNAAYRTFLQSYGPLGVTAPESWGDDGAFAEGTEAHPVVGVAFEHADAFCRALGKRLPSEAEWEVAASYSADASVRRLFPWSDSEGDFVAPSDDDSTYPAGSHPTNVSPLGVYDLAGNAWEYVDVSYDPRLGADTGVRIVRGGTNSFLLDNSSRKAGNPLEFYMAKWAGFRCAVAADAPTPTAEFQVLGFTPAPEPAPHVVLEPGEIDDDFKDPTFQPWPSRRTADAVWGYHPLDSFHLGTRGPGVDALAPKAVELTYEESQYTVKATGALVEARTESADGFCFGIGTNIDDQGQGLFLAVCPTTDPNNSVVKMFVRTAFATHEPIYPDKNIVLRRDDMVELRIDILGKDSFRMFVNGAQVGRDFVNVLSDSFSGFYDGRNVAMLLTSAPTDSTKVHVHFHHFTVDKVTEPPA